MNKQLRIEMKRITMMGDTPLETILIVDDTLLNVALLKRILAANGFTIYTAADGCAALEAVEACHPDLILLDIQMPEMDGFEVCTRLKLNEQTRDIPIIFISAITDTDEIVQALTLGGADYITKPFKIREVIARVNNQLIMVRQARQIEQLYEQDRRHFESLQKMKEEFMLQATHDLKNPLNVIMGYVYLLQNTPVQPENATSFTDWLGEISGSVDKMRRLVRDMLDLSQMQTGITLATEPVNLAAFLEKALTGYDRLAEQKQVELRFERPPDDLTVAIDAAKMTRVIDNLISNAIKYTPESGTVDVNVDVGGDYLEINVADTGLGIPAEDMSHLFDAFFRVSRAEHREQEGTGLGLSVVKAIVEQHQGTIEVNSVLGEGSKFSVVLPYHELAA